MGRAGGYPNYKVDAPPQTFLRDSFILKKQSSFNWTCYFCGCFYWIFKKKSILGLRRCLNQESDSRTNTRTQVQPLIKNHNKNLSTIAYAYNPSVGEAKMGILELTGQTVCLNWQVLGSVRDLLQKSMWRMTYLISGLHIHSYMHAHLYAPHLDAHTYTNMQINIHFSVWALKNLNIWGFNRLYQNIIFLAH